jgi:hypothetical protein
MARSAACLKMGHYPLPEPESRRIRLLLDYPGQAPVVDLALVRNGFQPDHGARDCKAIRHRTRCSKAVQA